MGLGGGGSTHHSSIGTVVRDVVCSTTAWRSVPQGVTIVTTAGAIPDAMDRITKQDSEGVGERKELKMLYQNVGRGKVASHLFCSWW